MKLKDIKEWVNSLPKEFLEFAVCSSEEGELTEDTSYRLDKPVISLAVDEENKEILFFNEAKEKDNE